MVIVVRVSSAVDEAGSAQPSDQSSTDQTFSFMLAPPFSHSPVIQALDYIRRGAVCKLSCQRSGESSSSLRVSHAKCLFIRVNYVSTRRRRFRSRPDNLSNQIHRRIPELFPRTVCT